MPHVHSRYDSRYEADRNGPGRAYTSTLLALAIAGLLTTCGGAVSPAGGSGGASGVVPPIPTSGDTTPPTTPASLQATTDGPFGATLLWTASTDSSGAVTYKVERCQGAGCSGFSEVAATAGPTFSDTGLLPATPYSYRVRATDAAANFSTYSNMAGVTTSASPPLPLGTLPAWMNGLVVGQWFAIPNTSMSSAAPATTPSGNTGPRSKVETWTSFAVDTRSSKVYSLANGGHQDYSGNEVDVLDLEAAVPGWSQVLAPTPNNQLTDCLPFYADGKPASRHSYYGVTFSETTDRFMLFGGAKWCSSGNFFNLITSYNITANTWSPAGTHPNLPDVIMAGGFAAYTVNPATGDVYAFRNQDHGRWNRSSNTFTVLSPNVKPDSLVGETMSAMDTVRGRILMLGGQDGAQQYYTVASDSFTSVTLSGTDAATLTGSGQGALVYVAAIDRYLARLKDLGGAVYQVHPTTFAVSTFVTTGGASIPAIEAGPYNKFLYVPRLGGVVYVPAYAGSAWFMKVN